MHRHAALRHAGRSWPARTSLTLFALSIAGVACGGDDDALPDTVEVVASDYTFSGLPGTIGSGTSLTLRNDSVGEVHELVAFALPSDIEGSASDILARPEEELAAFMDGPPALVVIAGPAEEGFVVAGDGTLPSAGRYLLFCGIPTGADPAAYLEAAATSDGPPDVSGGPPHFVHGMATTVDVVGPS